MILARIGDCALKLDGARGPEQLRATAAAWNVVARFLTPVLEEVLRTGAEVAEAPLDRDRDQDRRATRL